MARFQRVLGGLACLALGFGLAWAPWVHRVDLALLDEGFALRRRTPGPAPEVVILARDEATEKALPEPMALWHRHLGELFGALAEAKPRAVGLDLALPDRPVEALVPGSDAALLRGLLRLRRVCPVVVGVVAEGRDRFRTIHAPFQAAVGEDATGLLLVPVDPDGVLRRHEEVADAGGRSIPGLTGTLARRLGRTAERGWIDYGLGSAFPYVPLHEALAWARAGETNRLHQAFGGKVVLVGTVGVWEDRHPLPVHLAAWERPGGAQPGVLAHAQALRSLLGPGLLREVPRPWGGLLAGVLLAVGWIAGRRPRFGTGVALAGGLALLAAGYGLLGQGWVFFPAAPLAGLALGAAARGLRDAAERLRERSRLKRVFAGYVSPQVLRDIVEGRIQPGLQGERRALCVLFSDIRGFTTLSEGMAPEAVIALLNRYFDRMAEAVHAHGGTVDKFIGDGLMAFFGAPEVLAEPCESAVRAARAMVAGLEELNGERKAEGLPPLAMGIGLHFGEAAVGHVGGASRHEYTAIGDTVNTAARVEGLTKDAGCPVLATDTVVMRLAPGHGFEDLGVRPVKGRAAVQVFGWRPAIREEGP